MFPNLEIYVYTLEMSQTPKTPSICHDILTNPMLFLSRFAALFRSLYIHVVSTEHVLFTSIRGIVSEAISVLIPQTDIIVAHQRGHVRVFGKISIRPT
jgi:hypothetical protein